MTKTPDFFADLAAATTSLKVDGRYDLGKLKDKSASIARRGYKLDVDIHAVAVACLEFAMPAELAEEGAKNAEPARQLLASMPKGSRAKTLADWFEAHSNVRLKMGKDGKWSAGIAKGQMAHEDDKLRELATAGKNKPFFDVAEKTNGAQAFDLTSMLANFFSKADAAIKSGKIDDTALEGVEKLRDFAKANGLPTEKVKATAA